MPEWKLEEDKVDIEKSFEHPTCPIKLAFNDGHNYILFVNFLVIDLIGPQN
jgi:hypothetical protein